MDRVGDGAGLLEAGAGLDDPRPGGKVVYPLAEIMLVVLCGLLSGCDDFVGMALWGREHLGFLRRLRPFARGVPSHDTLNDVVNALDPALFEECFVTWVTGLRAGAGGEAVVAPGTIALDGKALRRSGDRRRGKAPLHRVSAWASRQRLVLAQEVVDTKANEIVASPRLLDQMVLTGAPVTTDAIGCQRATAQRILDAEAHYLVALRKNQRSLYAAVERTFDDRRAEGGFGLDALTTTDADHGRLEIRRHFVRRAIAALPKRHRWPGLTAVGRVEAEVQAAGKTTVARRYYLCSEPLPAIAFAETARGRWGIENNLHWVLDVEFRDDHARLRNGSGPRNMALMKRMAINLLNAASDRNSLKVRREKASWSTDHLLALPQGAPS